MYKCYLSFMAQVKCRYYLLVDSLINQFKINYSPLNIYSVCISSEFPQQVCFWLIYLLKQCLLNSHNNQAQLKYQLCVSLLNSVRVVVRRETENFGWMYSKRMFLTYSFICPNNKVKRSKPLKTVQGYHQSNLYIKYDLCLLSSNNSTHKQNV